jgi:IS5 family transposase
MTVWRALLNLSVTLLPIDGVVGIDGSGFDRSHASKHYTKRTKLTIQQLKLTLLVDTRVNAIIDSHVTTTRKHDSQIAPSLIRQNSNEVAILLGDNGYDDQKVRAVAPDAGVRPLIKHREFSSLHKAWNARLDADLYGQRSQNETVNSSLERTYGAFVRSRHWWKQFRERVVGCLTHDVDKSLRTADTDESASKWVEPFWFSPKES